MKKRNQTKETPLIYILSIFFLLIGFSFGLLFHSLFPNTISSSVKQVREDGYEYINPLIDFESIESAGKEELKKLEKEITDYYKLQVSNNPELSEISIYFKDLNSGAWIGINEKETFVPASLLKVQMLISCYKYAEDKQYRKHKLCDYKYFSQSQTGSLISITCF